MFRRVYGYMLAHTTKRGFWGAWYYRERYRRVLESILNLCGIDEFIILDAGCGLGIYGKLLSEHYPRYFYVGLDIDRGILKSAHRGPNVDYVLCDIRKLPILRGSVKISLCSEVLEHLDSPYESLEKICEATGETIIITFPEEKLLSIFKDRHPEHISEIDRKKILGVLRSSGFSVVKVSEIYTSFIPCGVLEFLRIPRNAYTEKIVKAIDRILRKIIPSNLVPHKTILIEAKRSTQK